MAMRIPLSAWKATLANFGLRRRKNNKKPAHSRTRSLQIESLEPRQLLAGDLITNGGFEADVVTDHRGRWELYSEVAGWTRESSAKIELQKGILGGPAEGLQHLELASNGKSAISQTVTTVTDQAYELKFSFSGRPGTSDKANILGVNITSGSNPVAFTLRDADGNSVNGDQLRLSGNSGWQEYTAIFVATGTETKIEFSQQGTSQKKGTFLDNVSLTETDEVPPPANLLVNGSFERGIVTQHRGRWHLFGGVAGDDIPGWEIESGSHIELQKGILGGPAEGLQHLELDAHGSDSQTTISQTANTTAGTVYNLQFAFSGRPGTHANNNKLGVEVLSVQAGQSESHIALQLFDESGNLVAEYDDQGQVSPGYDTDQDDIPDALKLPGNSGWRYFRAVFTAEGDATKIQFSDQGIANRKGSLIDDVVLAENAKPFFKEELREGTIGIHRTKDYVVGTVKAFDGNLRDVLTYKFVGGNEEGFFSLDEDSGELKLTKDAIDANSKLYELKVVAEDQSGAKSEEQTIKLEIVAGVTIAGDLHGVEKLDDGNRDNIELQFTRIVDDELKNVALEIHYEVIWGENPLRGGARRDDLTNPEALVAEGKTKGSVTVFAGKLFKPVELIPAQDLPEGITTFHVRLLPSPTKKYERIQFDFAKKNNETLIGKEEVEVTIVDGITLFAKGEFPTEGGTAIDGHEVHFNDIQQGALNDCFCMTAFGAMALRTPEEVKSLIETVDGKYKVKLYPTLGGAAVTQTVDPVGLLSRGEVMAQLSGDTDADGNAEIWPIVLERAYAQQFGEEALDFGNAHVVWERLTNREAKLFETKNLTHQEIAEKLQGAEARKEKVVIGRGGSFDVLVKDGRLLKGKHAFLVTKVEEGTVFLHDPLQQFGEPFEVPLADIKPLMTTIYIQANE